MLKSCPVETRVYVDEAAQRRGITRASLESLLAALTNAGFVTAIASVSLPNGASVALHEALGFRLAGTIHAPGYKLGQWVDIGYFQRDPVARMNPPGEPRR